MKKFSFILVAMLTAMGAHGATVNWSATIDTGLIGSGAAALAAGNFIRIGYFGTLTDAQVTSNALTLAGISVDNADFHEFANSTVGTGFGGLAGGFNVATSKLYASIPGFDTSTQHQIYFWALKATDNSSLATALATTTQTAIGYVPSANLATWKFPSAGPPDTNVTNIDLTDLSNANRQILAGTYVAGTSASLTPNFGSPNHALQLADVSSVPEPSTLTFGALAALVAAGSRRRRRE
jgi:MYXO-CTERM domain-containing protein